MCMIHKGDLSLLTIRKRSGLNLLWGLSKNFGDAVYTSWKPSLIPFKHTYISSFWCQKFFKKNCPNSQMWLSICQHLYRSTQRNQWLEFLHKILKGANSFSPPIGKLHMGKRNWRDLLPGQRGDHPQEGRGCQGQYITFGQTQARLSTTTAPTYTSDNAAEEEGSMESLEGCPFSPPLTPSHLSAKSPPDNQCSVDVPLISLEDETPFEALWELSLSTNPWFLFANLQWETFIAYFLGISLEGPQGWGFLSTWIHQTALYRKECKGKLARISWRKD